MAVAAKGSMRDALSLVEQAIQMVRHRQVRRSTVDVRLKLSATHECVVTGVIELRYSILFTSDRANGLGFC